MKITVVSDLHMEFSPITLTNEQQADVLILAGDILMSEILHDYPRGSDKETYHSSRQLKAWRFREFLQECSDNFTNVIYVAGNHEFYQGKFYSGLEYLREECSFYPNVHFLEKNTVTIDDVIFIGATLWTDANKGDPLTMYQLPHMMNDYRIIRNDHSGFRRLSIEDTVKRHHESMDYIEMMVENSASDKKIVVVTHHSPSYQSIVSKYDDQFEMNGGYHSDLSKFILDNNIALWVHGHTHEVLDYTLGNTRIVCNPRGYEGESYSEQTGWNPNLLLEI